MVNQAKLKFLTCELIRSNYFTSEFLFRTIDFATNDFIEWNQMVLQALKFRVVFLDNK